MACTAPQAPLHQDVSNTTLCLLQTWLWCISLQACSQQQLTSVLLNSPVSAASWAPTLCRCFAFERSAAALLMYNTSQAGPHAALGRPQLTCSATPNHPNNNHPHGPHQTAPATDTYGSNQSLTSQPASALLPEAAASEQSETRAGGIAGSPTPLPTSTPTQPAQPASATAGASHESDGIELATVVLPRMPLGLKHITSGTAYTAVANVARALGKCSVAAGCQQHTLSGWHSSLLLLCQVMHSSWWFVWAVSRSLLLFSPRYMHSLFRRVIT